MRISILIIEDNPDHRELFCDLLEKEYEIFFSETLEETEYTLERHEIYCIVLDYYLKNKFSGLDILKKITKIDPFVPVIIITAYGNEEIAAETIKAGAVEYIKKTPDNRFLKNLEMRIKEIVSQRLSFSYKEKISMTEFFKSYENQFLKIWKEKIIYYKERINSGIEIEVKDSFFFSLFQAFLEDLQNEAPKQTLYFLKNMIWEENSTTNSLLFVELLNTSFKEAARQLLFLEFPHAFDGRTKYMKRIGALVDENDLMLSCEYEKIVSQSTEKILRAERINTKLLLMRTLQHEIRQPLSFIYNSTELLIDTNIDDNTKLKLREILDQSIKIDELLSELEKDSETPLKNYSDELPMFDLSSNKGN